jgi:hypothetical protein
MLGLLSGKNGDPLEVHLAGNIRSQDDQNCINILDTMADMDFVKIKSADLSKRDDMSESLAIDARDGKIYTQFDATRIRLAGDTEFAELRLRLPSSLLEVYGGYNISGREADFKLDLEKAYRAINKPFDKEMFDVLSLLIKPNDAVKDNKEALNRGLGNLTPVLGKSTIDQLQKKYTAR